MQEFIKISYRLELTVHERQEDIKKMLKFSKYLKHSGLFRQKGRFRGISLHTLGARLLEIMSAGKVVMAISQTWAKGRAGYGGFSS